MIPFHPLANIFPLLEGERFAEIVADMQATGFRMGEEIVILDGQILDGRNRYRAAIAAGLIAEDADWRTSWHFVEFSTDGVDGVFTEAEIAAGPLQYVIAKNINRRHLNDDQRRMAAARAANLARGQHPAECGITIPKAATLLNVDAAGVERARTVITTAATEIQKAVDAGMLTVNAAAQAAKLAPELQLDVARLANAGQANAVRTVIKQKTRATREADKGKAIAALPEEKFGLIAADPEWRFEVWSRRTGLDRAADNHYSTSPQDVIAARRALIDGIAAADSVLALWVTDLARGLDTLRDLGFTFKSYFVWVKTHRALTLDDVSRAALARQFGWDIEDAPHTLLMREKPPGTGYWNVDEDELLLIGTRGNPVCPAPGEQGGSVWYEPRREHSVKPECFFAWADRHFAHTPRIELNARRRRPGWQAWGDEVVPTERWRHAAERDALARGLIDAHGTVYVPPHKEGPSPVTVSASVPFDFVTEAEWQIVLGGSAEPRKQDVGLAPETEVAEGATTADRAEAPASPSEPSDDIPFVRAADVHDDSEQAIRAQPHVLVSEPEYPALHAAFEIVSHDSGAGCGYADYAVPTRYADGLPAIESALSDLSKDELETFACGEQSESLAIAERSAALTSARDLLNAFFEGFTDDIAPEGSPAGAPQQAGDGLDIPPFLRRIA
jgi:N6-adenosine-specific RNA methylase IME4/ribosomal protein S20